MALFLEWAHYRLMPMTYEERQVIREAVEELQRIAKIDRLPIINNASDGYAYALGQATMSARLLSYSLEALLSDPDDLPSAAYDANDAQEMGRL